MTNRDGHPALHTHVDELRIATPPGVSVRLDVNELVRDALAAATAGRETATDQQPSSPAGYFAFQHSPPDGFEVKSGQSAIMWGPSGDCPHIQAGPFIIPPNRQFVLIPHQITSEV
jgi:hypothetical protein